MTSAPITHHLDRKGTSGRTFDLMIGGTRRGYLSYSLPDDVTMAVDYVEVDDPLRGKGMGEQLIGAAADWARATGRTRARIRGGIRFQHWRAPSS